MMNEDTVRQAYQLARERYASFGVDTDAALDVLKGIPISIHCWQGDDVGGFERDAGGAGGGILSTGNYPGKASTPEQLRADLDLSLSLIPGTHRLNLHSIYAETGGERVDRDQLKPHHFQSWVDWVRTKGMGMDFNPSFFSHPKADTGFTLSSVDEEIRTFWIEHGKACRKIAEFFGRELNTPCINNIWIPDGYKDNPVDRDGARKRLKKSLDEIFAEEISKDFLLDAVESKLFGIGAESCTVGSHEFYMGYAVQNNIMLCLDAGHFHPTEVISDKLSAILLYVDEILLHVSRPVRWDSDHVVAFDDELQAIAQEIVRGDHLDRVHIGLDFFDATINRLAAWVIGTRNMIKALCKALLEPTEELKKAEESGDYTTRLALHEEMKMMPFAAVWDFYCLKAGVPVGSEWLAEIRDYEREVLFKR